MSPNCQCHLKMNLAKSGMLNCISYIHASHVSIEHVWCWNRKHSLEYKGNDTKQKCFKICLDTGCTPITWIYYAYNQKFNGTIICIFLSCMLISVLIACDFTFFFISFYSYYISIIFIRKWLRANKNLC